MSELSSLKADLETWNDLTIRSADLVELAEIAMDESDDSMGDQLTAELDEITAITADEEFKLQLNGVHDARPAIISIKQGAGGVDAQDWAEILFRMYVRWAERRGFKADVLDLTAGDEAGIKSAAVKVDGSHAYGYLRSERGVHRLVRLSPFDADHLRHTSFALVEVLPEPDAHEELTIDPDDLKIDTFRASGHGGQNVQKNSSAVRMTHLPSGFVVSVQNERSLRQNKDIAMRILYAKLMDLEMQKRAEEQARLRGDHVSPEWGRQVRSYVLHPYQMVKDHRSAYQTSNAQNVLDGDLDDLIKASLNAQVKGPGSQEQ
jgi:peptide chain release factor 2